MQAEADAVTALVAEAQRAASGDAYAWTLQACDRLRAQPWEPPACTQVSLAHWARADPGNAWPWMMLASRAQEAGDASGAESALARASLAADWTHPAERLRRLYTQAAPVGVQTEEFLEGWMALMTWDTQALGGPIGVVRACSAPLDPNRQQVCARLARAMMEKSTTLLGLKLGIAIAEQAAVSGATVQAARSEAERINALVRAEAPPVERAGRPDVAQGRREACSDLDDRAARALRLGLQGERATLMEDVRQRSGSAGARPPVSR